jgi:Ni,Fe-hydrogenase III component G
VTWKEIEKGLLDRFAADVVARQWSNERRVVCRLRAGAIGPVAGWVAGTGQARLLAVTGSARASGETSLWYHFDFFQAPVVLSLEIRLAAGTRTAVSLSGRIPAAAWMEREAAERHGLRFEPGTDPGEGVPVGSGGGGA